ncbi:hypothetical protein EV1_040156 [Malus domestica]
MPCSDSSVSVISQCTIYLGVGFVHAKTNNLSLEAVLQPNADVPHCFREFFAYERTLSYSGHFRPLAAVQVTELADAVFIGCTVNHSVVDGTSFWIRRD